MSRLVLDASIALSWLLSDEANAKAADVRDEMLKADNTFVPGHWRLEVCNSLWMVERKKRLDAAGVAQAVSLVTQLPLLVDMATNDRAGSETLSLARQHSLSVYDAAYLELALRHGARLASLDQALRSVAKKLGVSVLPEKLPGESTEKKG